uniref:Uncharacterized protein n=1 Tax=uncultured Armatimonadetes bacterium TaxID=157466 RepID=A0A6J4KA43_9BACT|nr:hypothetical protein AVDCRST_MAG63-5066 [uncultured Armatimonadetes bacterium]
MDDERDGGPVDRSFDEVRGGDVTECDHIRSYRTVKKGPRH